MNSDTTATLDTAQTIKSKTYPIFYAIGVYLMLGIASAALWVSMGVSVIVVTVGFAAIFATVGITCFLHIKRWSTDHDRN